MTNQVARSRYSETKHLPPPSLKHPSYKCIISICISVGVGLLVLSLLLAFPIIGTVSDAEHATQSEVA
jgi:hypothetical protein